MGGTKSGPPNGRVSPLLNLCGLVVGKGGVNLEGARSRDKEGRWKKRQQSTHHNTKATTLGIFSQKETENQRLRYLVEFRNHAIAQARSKMRLVGIGGKDPYLRKRDVGTLYTGLVTDGISM